MLKLRVFFICASFLVLPSCVIAADQPSNQPQSTLPSAVQASISADTETRSRLVADPWAQLAKLTASFDQSGLFFGTSIAISGDTIVIGQTDPGQALVFIKPKRGWRNMTQAATLISSDENVCDFAVSVAISGDTIAVGASQDAWWCSVKGPGAAYVFVKPASGWSGTLTPNAKLTASDGAVGDALGSSIGVSGKTVLSGAPGSYPFTTPGATYVFVEPATGWVNETQTAKLTASDGKNGAQLGYSASISRNTVVAGAPYATIRAHQSQGAIYVFTKPAGGWANKTQTAKLTASDGGKNNYLGNSVSADGNTVIGGAPYATVGSQKSQGAAYLYVEPSGGWTNMNETAKLTAVYHGVLALGFSVALDNNTAVAGAPYIDSGQNLGGGAAYVFVKPKTGWETASSNTRLVGSDAKFRAYMGSSVAVDGHTVVAGAPAISQFTGAAYLFWHP